MFAGVKVTLNYGDCKTVEHQVLQSSLAAQGLDLLGTGVKRLQQHFFLYSLVQEGFE